MKDKNNIPSYKNPELPIEKRVEDLLSRLTLGEKITQMLFNSPAVERLDIPQYNWWNEGLHGVARAGVATVFPQAIGLGATFDEEFMEKVAEVISDEARAKYNEHSAIGDRGIYKGLTYWSPNINIFRDPRWGRGHETYGEDPYLTSRMGIAFIKGLQGNDPKYKKLDATIKHYAVHSGPEGKRHEFNVDIDIKQMRETYLYAFRECVRETEVSAVMGAYNRVNGEPCCGSKTLLEDFLRKEWGFEGYVVSDCGAICDFHEHHKVTHNAAESSAMAVNNGCDLNCGNAYTYLKAAVASGMIPEENIDKALRRLLFAKFKLGMFDAPEIVPYSNLNYDSIDTKENRELALEAAKKSIVLLKNEKNTLPLNKDIKAIAVIGPNADSKDVLLGNYNGTPSEYSTMLQGIRNRASKNTKIIYAEGCDLTKKDVGSWAVDLIPEAVIAAKKADAVVICLGLSPRIEGEQGDAFNSDASGDRIDITLPGRQEALLKAVAETGKPIILVLSNGSAIALGDTEKYSSAILEAWYPGEEGGNAVADVIFGNYNPAGRLPVTFVKSVEDLPDFEDYDMEGRTYRFMNKEPLYPFGFGLSYTKFNYSNLKLSCKELNPQEDIDISFEIENVGGFDGEEVVQIYLKDLEASTTVPNHSLVALRRVALNKGEKQALSFKIKARQMAVIKEDGSCVIEPGSFAVYVGGSQPDELSKRLTGGDMLKDTFFINGEEMIIEY
ncbi:glycoside hydrolase family 3 C-terminal domain-containing protein [Clostridium swellfunianum]|uniref:glycoside hydrolase family 3 C-terminal domain-containing protein n=1 Tax=Clostridium swellfunianum TaxID=1367462 RepID=UPI00202EB5F9|nr:glycoside hydrolase family 3 C-terminal domain-containing protein [Clostridium swellfunianum]MCM0649676.1 glycoside hydrolase family 3 C-terminal domain-containing protein [Clostridium swellfunianum]